MNPYAEFKKSTSRFGIVKSGLFVPLIYYKEDWNKLIRYVEKNHFVGKYRGYAMHKCLLDFMTRKLGQSTPLVIIKRPTNEKFFSTLQDWHEKGIGINWQDEQVCLPVAFMTRPVKQVKTGRQAIKKIETLKQFETNPETVKHLGSGINIPSEAISEAITVFQPELTAHGEFKNGTVNQS